MIPVISLEPVLGDLLPPANLSKKALEDWENGPAAIQDPSQGLKFQVWRAWKEDTGEVFVDAPNQAAPTLLLIEPAITRLALAFDQLGRWLCAYQTDAAAFLRWFDPVEQAYDTLALPSGVTSLFMTMDDGRQFASELGLNDVVITYLRADALWVRVQRDRFLQERLISANLQESTRIWHFGMNSKLRLQWELR